MQSSQKETITKDRVKQSFTIFLKEKSVIRSLFITMAITLFIMQLVKLVSAYILLADFRSTQDSLADTASALLSITTKLEHTFSQFLGGVIPGIAILASKSWLRWDSLKELNFKTKQVEGKFVSKVFTLGLKYYLVTILYSIPTLLLSLIVLMAFIVVKSTSGQDIVEQIQNLSVGNTIMIFITIFIGYLPNMFIRPISVLSLMNPNRKYSLVSGEFIKRTKLIAKKYFGDLAKIYFLDVSTKTLVYVVLAGIPIIGPVIAVYLAIYGNVGINYLYVGIFKKEIAMYNITPSQPTVANQANQYTSNQII